MLKRVIIVSAAGAAVAAFALGVHAEGDARLNFGLENDTGRAMTSLMLSPAGDDDWTAVTLDRGRIGAGASTQVRMDGAGRQCEYDVRADLDGGQAIEKDDVNLCDLDAGTLVLD